MSAQFVIAKKYWIYLGVMELLKSNHTTVAERKTAITVRDEFRNEAPRLVGQLLDILGSSDDPR